MSWTSAMMKKRLVKYDIYEQQGRPCQTDFICFGKEIGLNDKQIRKTWHYF